MKFQTLGRLWNGTVRIDNNAFRDGRLGECRAVLEQLAPENDSYVLQRN